MESQTVVALWLFSCLALVIMGTRLVLRKMAKQPFNLGDYLTMGACLCCIARLSMTHVVLIWGTNNVSVAIRKTHVFSADEIYRRTIGSKLAITARCFYNTFLWLQKFVLLDVYRRLLLGTWYEKHIMIVFLSVLSSTWVVVTVVVFTECHPFRLYWQVVPDPGTCVEAQMELFVMASLNILTDVMLLTFPFLLFTHFQTSWKLKLRLFALFTLGVFIVIITIVRLPITRENRESQPDRSMWTSTEMFVATIVVNAPTIYGLWNNLRRRKRPDTLQSNSQVTGGAGQSGERPTLPQMVNA
ncbi:hypothetical protein B0J13DRAFT_550454 [Dactylonectria estremocensis]|uniref:Rhodopsin domain-containing protein n=1 Tax=Dactylonectria estremocensis TaxID=1079267 RepID=A0A9P9J991_9HYPO|nr:hypothetical protein B0J13DRAFT_550454 [Dactylonectria estremocensis]